jgi:hypothetical protein
VLQCSVIDQGPAGVLCFQSLFEILPATVAALSHSSFLLTIPACMYSRPCNSYVCMYVRISACARTYCVRACVCLCVCVCVQLGATLANHNKSEQAVQVYAKALNIRPTYARGWLNLGEDGICVTVDLETSHNN